MTFGISNKCNILPWAVHLTAVYNSLPPAEVILLSASGFWESRKGSLPHPAVALAQAELPRLPAAA